MYVPQPVTTEALRVASAASTADRSGAFSRWGLRGARVRTKLFGVVLAACFTILALTGAAIAALRSSIEDAAQLEARNLALSVALEASHRGGDLQSYVASLDELYKRDLFIVDAHRITVGDILPAELGTIYSSDRHNEIGLTLQDGIPRAFVEFSPQHPEGAKQMAVPIKAAGRDSITGVVVLEYTNISAQLYRANVSGLFAIGLAGLVAVVAIGWIGWEISRRHARNIQQIHEGVHAFATGNASFRIAALDPDEVGDLAWAFNQLADELQRSQQELLMEMALAKEAAHHSEILAYTDKLTGLANRTEMARLMGRMLPDAAKDTRMLGVLFLDLDRFKNVNDTLGHASGDQLLKVVASRLSQTCGDDVNVCRLGGDEFVILVPGLDAPSRLAGLARRILIAVAQPVRLEGQELRVTASIGISVFPENGADEHILMKHADIALYQAKDMGRNDFVFYTPSLNPHSIERLAFESEVRRAVEKQQFTVHYQPKIALSSGEVEGVEALLRWHHPTMGLVSPMNFIPVAEETGLIVTLGLWVLEQACRQQVAWLTQGLPSIKMAVNLSARQFTDENLLSDIRRVLNETGVAPEALELEITESMLAQNEVRCLAILHELKSLGLHVALDDFGTGYSSLAKLKEYPVDTLKVDRAFVRDLETNAEDQAIAQAIVTLGQSMGMTLVAEGVETAAQLDFLRERGCDLIQGYYFSRPLPAEQLVEYAKERHALVQGTRV